MSSHSKNSLDRARANELSAFLNDFTDDSMPERPANLPHRNIPIQTDSESQVHSLIGQTIGSWKINAIIGFGGMGAVYAASNITEKNVTAALKVILPVHQADEDFRARFLQEIQVTQQLNHPNIVRVLDFNKEIPYLALQYLETETLERVITSRRRLPIEDALHIADQILGALEYSHSLGIIHRDLTPSNIMVGEDLAIWVSDFGLGFNSFNQKERLTLTGQAMGSPHYISPEQIRNAQAVEATADLYSFGCLFHHMLSGATPYPKRPNEAIEAVLKRHLTQSPRDVRSYIPSASNRLANLLLSLMDHNPARRPQNAAAVRQELELIRDELDNSGLEYVPTETITIGAGTLIDGWTVVGPLKQGGMGQLFQLRQGSEKAVLKLLKADVPHSGKDIKRLLREGRVLQKLEENTNIIKVLSYGTVSQSQVEHPFVILESAACDLAEVLEQGPVLTPGDAVTIGRAVAQALIYAHSKEILHRDVKPQNILLVNYDPHNPNNENISEEQVRLADFGIAKLLAGQEQEQLTVTGEILGSRDFMAPEQWQGESGLSKQVDVYGLGATLFFLLSGGRLFTADSPAALMEAHLNSLPPSLDEITSNVDEELALIVDSALIKDPKHRTTMTVFLNDLRDWQTGLRRQRLKVLRKKLTRYRKNFKKNQKRGRNTALALLIVILSVTISILITRPSPYSSIEKRLQRLAVKTDSLTEKTDRMTYSSTLSELDSINHALKELEKEEQIDIPEVTEKLLIKTRDTLARKSWRWYSAKLRLTRTHPNLEQLKETLINLDGLAQEVTNSIEGKQGTIIQGQTLEYWREERNILLNSLEALAGLKKMDPQISCENIINQAKSIRSSISNISGPPKSAEHLVENQLLERFSKLKSSADKQYNQLISKLDEMQARLEKIDNDRDLILFRKELDLLINGSLDKNPTLRKRAIILSRKDPISILIAQSLRLVKLRLAEQPKDWPVIISLINQMKKQYGEHPSMSQVKVILTNVFVDRDKEAAMQFEELCQKHETRFQGLVGRQELQKYLAEIVAFPTDPRLKGWSLREVKIKKEVGDYELLEKLLPKKYIQRGRSELNKHGERSLMTNPQSKLSQRAFLEWIAQKVEQPILVAKSYRIQGADVSEITSILKTIKILRSFHRDEGMFLVSPSGGRGTIEAIIGQQKNLKLLHNHSPVHIHKLSPYKIDRFEVSNSDYQKFLEFLALYDQSTETVTPLNWGKQKKKKNLPVRNVSHSMAMSFSYWTGKRLPTEFEWEHAARASKNRLYAWGDNELNPLKARYEGIKRGPAPVKSMKRGATTLGQIHHLTGNVAEWTSSRPLPYPGNNQKNLFDVTGEAYVVRGGSFMSLREQLPVWLREAIASKKKLPYVGFRCVAHP